MTGEFIRRGLLDGEFARLVPSYRVRCEALLQGLAEHMPEGVTWTRPGGGFFTWVTLPPGLESGALLAAAEAHGVTYVPGTPFCSGGGGERSLRLSFSLLSAGESREGPRRLGRAVRQALAGC